MNIHNIFQQKITHWLSEFQKNSEPFRLEGSSQNETSYLFSEFLKNAPDNFPKQILFVTPTIEEAEEFYSLIKSGLSRELFDIILFTGLEVSPYSSVLVSESSLFYRFSSLDKILHPEKRQIVVMDFEAAALKLPPPQFFLENIFEIKTEDIIAPDELASKLVALGYNSATTVEEPGTFSKKGEIFDIYPMSMPPIRLHYFDDLIEEIFAIDPETLKTIKEQKLNIIRLGPTPQLLANAPYTLTLRENIPMPSATFKAKFSKRKILFENLSRGLLFENHPLFTPLFFNQTGLIKDYLGEQHLFVILNEGRQDVEWNSFCESLREDYDKEEQNQLSDSLTPAPERIYTGDLNNIWGDSPKIIHNEINLNAIQQKNEQEDLRFSLDLKLKKARNFLYEFISPTLSRPEFIEETFKFLKKYLKKDGKIIFTTSSQAPKDEINHLLNVMEFDPIERSKIQFVDYKLGDGIYHESSNTLIISESDIFSVKKSSKIKKQKKYDVDLFAEQISTLKIGDYVIHSDHGIGKYLGLEKLEFNGIESDFVIIEYTGNDKVYVPVYKLNLIQKHADGEASVRSDSLRTNQFSKLKTRARSSIKKLAFDLLKLQAQREATEAYAFSPPDHLYKEFELAFPFDETPDQAGACDDVILAMQSTRPMDFLVCGDVGFGKTEVAMRAAYKAVLDGKQVAILVPTTILALQHYHSFKKRFKDFPVTIDFLSRFKSTKEAKEIKEKLSLGKIDIIIGTHALLASSVTYRDLGLVIVDEEQRFGVGHKEKLKLLKASLDFLTLTATPIPRTMQLAFLGLKNLSLIKTAPPKRQSIKTYVIKEDPLTIQTALKKELARGGQSYIVHNRVQDIEQYTANIRDLIPEAKIIYAHGQLPENELEKRMKAFYEGEYQILVSTTIIESGIDIPNANTMIVDRADTYGLSQLHQLRGRIGRSERKAYAYFVVPATGVLSSVAEKRLKALKTYAQMGSGFNIASSDLEIRGAGDILGGEQSGHIEAIGLELYTELLKEAVAELKGETKLIKKDIEFNTPFAAFIPSHYIPDASLRLKYYKKLANCNSLDELNHLKTELEDIFGVFQEEIFNLLNVLECRLSLQYCAVKNVQVAGTNIFISFEKSLLESSQALQQKIVETFMARPKVYRFTPDYKVIYTHKEKITPTSLLKFCHEIAQQIVPC